MKFTIEPFVGVGPVRFGSTRAQVRATLAVPVESLLRNDDDAAETDVFESLGLYVEYDKDDRCVSVEMFSPADPVFRDKRLLAVPYAEIKVWIRTLDPGVEIDEGGLASNTLGIGMAADVGRNDKNSRGESVIAFTRGYFEE